MKTALVRFNIVLVLLAGLVSVRAANVSLTTSDPINTSSMNTAGVWNNAQVPSAANDYFTSTFFMRTPIDSGGVTYTFAGHSLTLQAPAGQGNPMRSILYKGGANDTIVINNLTNAAGGVLNQGGSGNVTVTFNGNLWTIAANSTLLVDQGPAIIGYPLAGADGVILTNAGGNTMTFSGSLGGFTGKFFITRNNNNGGGGNTTVVFGAGSSNLGNPASATPDQITVSGGTTLTDNAGLTFNNSNGGITLLATAGQNSATINAGATTIIGEVITDQTNAVSSVCTLTKAGSGNLVLSNANNNYSGGTTVSAGILRLGVDNAIPGNSVAGNVTVNGATLDMNGHNATINALNGNGTVDTQSGGPANLTVGRNGANGTFTGTIGNSSGTLTLTKIGAGTQTIGGYNYSGVTIVAGGTLSLSSATLVPSVPGDLVVSNGAALTADVSSGNALPAANVVVGTNSTLSLTLSSTANGVNAASLTLQDNATNNFAYGILAANPTAPAINVSGGISAPGTNVVINISAIGLKTGTFTLIKYGSGTLADIANFQFSPPPGVAATLVNNTGNKSIDVNITSIPNQLAWNGVNGGSWDLVTPNWTNLGLGGITVFRQYTNGSVIAGDAVTFDDTLTNDFVNPQPTNIVLNSRFFAFPFLVNSTLPYSIAGSGGIQGVTSLVKSNTGSLTLLTSNSFSGGVTLNDSGTLVITNDSALGASSVGLTLNGATLQMNGGVTNNRPISMPTASTFGVGSGATARLSGVISGAGTLNKTGAGTLILAAAETITGNVFGKGGTLVLDSGGSINNGGLWTSIGQDTTDVSTLTLQGTGAFTNTADFNVGDIDSSVGTLNISGTAVVSVQQLFIASANNAGSTATGTVNMNGGSLIEKNTGAGNFVVGGRNAATSGGVGVINLTNGYISGACGVRVGDFGTGTVNQYGGVFEATNNATGINLHRENTTTSFGTYNLNGGTLRTEKVTTSFTSTNSLFYFNGGTLQAANGNLGTTPFMNQIYHAYIRNGGAVIDCQGFGILISQPLEHSNLGGDNAIDGGLTKLGSGTVTLSGVNTFTGAITNKGGTLILNSASTYSNTVSVNVGTLQLISATALQGNTIVSNGATLSIVQAGPAGAALSNLTFSGTATLPGATLALVPTNTASPLVNCGTLTLNGTNSINLAAVSIGTIPIVKYTGAIAGSGNITNLILPQGATGFVSNNAANSTLYAVITSTGPGLVWTGTNTTALNTWNIGVTTNWLVNGIPTSYHQLVSPGDSVIFNDVGSGTVLLNTNVAPTSILISNVSKSYTLSGNGTIAGPSGLLKLGSGTAVLNLTNNSYLGDSVISNGTLQLNAAAGLAPNANLVVGASGKLQLSGVSQTFLELTGAGIIDNNSGNTPTLTVGGSSGGTWNGRITNSGAGGMALHKVGAGTWVVGGNNNLDDGQTFVDRNQVNQGTVIITNGGKLSMAYLQFQIASGANQTGTVVVAGGSLVVTNNVLSVGFGDNTANGTLIVNSGIVDHSGFSGGTFASVPNSIDVGAQGASGTLIVNGGQVLNNLILFLGDGTGANGIARLNGGLLQASVVQPNGTPTASTIYFNGGTLLAATNTADFILSTPLVQSGGAVIDDGGFAVVIASQSLQEDPSSTGGGLTKKGSGTLYLDSGNSYSGLTVVMNGTLAGAGSLNSPVVIGPAGGIGAGDAGGRGTLTVNNSLTIQGKAAMRIDKTGGGLNSDQITGLSTVTYGGTLVISNVTSDATPLVAGDTFTLFSATTHAGNFANIVGSPGGSLGFSFANGVLTVIAVAPNPTNISFSVSGSTLALSWPADHLGWFVQSNSVSIVNPGAWFDIPGSQSTTTLNVTVNPAQPQIYFRMRHP